MLARPGGLGVSLLRQRPWTKDALCYHSPNRSVESVAVCTSHSAGPRAVDAGTACFPPNLQRGIILPCRRNFLTSHEQLPYL